MGLGGRGEGAGAREEGARLAGIWLGSELGRGEQHDMGSSQGCQGVG